MGFGELAKGKTLTKTVASNAAVIPAADWKVAGTSAPKVDGRAIVTGKHQYASDIKRPGLLFGKVLRPIGMNASLVSADLEEAQAMSDVVVVRDGDFIGVAAPTHAAPNCAIAAIRANGKRRRSPRTPSCSTS